MNLVQIGTRIVNLNQIVSAEYSEDEAHPSYPQRVFSQLTIYYSGSFNYSTFYEAEANALWNLLRTNSKLNLHPSKLTPSDPQDVEPPLAG